MYSYEIDQTIKSHNYNIDSELYINICNTSPQISRVKYDPNNKKYEILTKDNFYWQIKVERKGNEL